jgi:4-hydroxybenzoate polyprenyltransferase
MKRLMIFHPNILFLFYPIINHSLSIKQPQALSLILVGSAGGRGYVMVYNI